ncbi:MAG TPA: beta-L-arabinofuranosidase domain-containing protein [Bryobacteraceae bacterium]|nr:beta-L-arabinofuranosidase domain-containing protein [Bryobacteraceae bacterium]
MILNSLSRREALGIMALGAIPSRPRVADALSPLPLHDVRLGGALGRRLDLCIRNRIFAQDVERLVEPFRHRQERTCWQTEFWGKWFLAAAAACQYTGDSAWRARLHESARQLLVTQTPDGYIGNYAVEDRLKAWDVWGRKYTLFGLLAAYDLTGDTACLTGARRLADQLMMEVGPLSTDIVTLGLYRGMAASSVLEPIVRLYRSTGDDRHLQYARYIVDRWSGPRGPQLVEKALGGVPVGQRYPPPRNWWSWENGEKAYEMMSCYSGLIELYRETGWQPGLDAALRTAESIRDTEINVAGSGSAAECWYGGRALQVEPRDRSMETCVAVTWMQLCASLLRITGDPRWGDEIEKTAYNALAGAMTPDGSSFAQYNALAGVRSLGELQCGMGLNCCVANGPRGLMMLPEVAVMADARGPVVNLYSEGFWKLRLPSGAAARFAIKSEYPKSGDVELFMEVPRSEPFRLRLRIPQWSESTAVAVNGTPVSEVRPGTWAVIDRRWMPGDHVRLQLDMRATVTSLADRGQQFAAVLRGPLALAQDLRLGGSLDEPLTLSAGRAALKEVAAPAGVEATWSLPSGAVLCDYSSAGNTWDARSRYRVWVPQR